MTNTKTIFVCSDYSNIQWELPITAAERVFRCLVAWQLNSSSEDGGIPDNVARILASTLVNHVLVTFPTYTDQRGISFAHTNRIDDVRQAFDAEYFHWSHRGQIIFLSPLEAQPPTLSEECLNLATDSENLYKLNDMGVIGLILPGVDGDLAGIYTFTKKLQNELINELKTVCIRNEVKFLEVSEDLLMEVLAT